MHKRVLPVLLLLAFAFAPLGGALFAEEDPAPAPAPKEGEKDAEKKEDGPAKVASDEERKRTQELVKELSAITSEIRGLAWKKPVEADLLTRTQMLAYMQKQVKEEVDPKEIERAHLMLRRLGMIKPDQDIVEMTLDMLTGVAGGFFNPKTKKIYMLAGQDPESQKPTIVHELCHALEDQYVDLEKTQEALKEDSDGMFAFKCLIEGSAEIVRLLYEEREPAAAQAQMAGQSKNKELVEGQRRTFANTPAFMLLNTLLHYRTGPDFVMKALGDDYKGGIDALFANRPTTQEQVLHPERWIGEKKDYPEQITWDPGLAASLGDGWKQLEDMVQGELDLALWMDFYLGPDDGKLSPKHMQTGMFVVPSVRKAAEGWDGSRLLFLQGPEKDVVVAMAMAFDTQKDAVEGFDALRATVSKMYADDWAPGASTGKPEEANQGFDYVGGFGDGRIVRRGTRVLWLDGLEGAEMKKAWPAVLKTSFTKDKRDTWTPADEVDIFAGCEIVDRDRGVGLDVPEGWEFNAQAIEMLRNNDPMIVASATHEDSNGGKIMAVLRLVNQGMSRGVMGEVLKSEFGKQIPFDPARVSNVTVNGWKGIAYDVFPPQVPQILRVTLASDGNQTLFGLVRGARPSVTELSAEIKAFFEGVRIKLGY